MIFEDKILEKLTREDKPSVFILARKISSWWVSATMSTILLNRLAYRSLECSAKTSLSPTSPKSYIKTLIRKKTSVVSADTYNPATSSSLNPCLSRSSRTKPSFHNLIMSSAHAWRTTPGSSGSSQSIPSSLFTLSR